MAETYDITFEGTPVGTTRVEKQGLYYKFSCRCPMPDEGLYRIHVICGEIREDLGICVPMEEFFGMDKKIPVKRLGKDGLRFELVPKDWTSREPVLVQEPALLEEKQSDNEAQWNTNTESEEDTQWPMEKEKTFVPVLESEPFEYLDKLEDAVMETQSEEIGILLQQ